MPRHVADDSNLGISIHPDEFGKPPKMRKVIPKKLKTVVYNSIINSQLSYGISVWGAYSNIDRLKPLFILQKKSIAQPVQHKASI